ncbi:MAG TPA: helix-turn-helix domain-containing protein [Solirubrobacteraceae bacterium]|jgi:hypothetical protein
MTDNVYPGVFVQIDQKLSSAPHGQWKGLDSALATALRAQLRVLGDEIIAAIGQAIPEYRRPMEGAFGSGVRAGVQRALEQFIAKAERAGAASSSDREIYRELGRGELRAGRGLDALQAAYRLGARLSWRRISMVAREWGADAATVSMLAELMFAHIEEISASSVEGYVQAQAQLAGERERRRDRLVRLLLAGTEALEEQVLRANALEAGWVLPARLAVLVCESPEALRLSAQIDGGAIGARVEELTCVLLADPDAPSARGSLHKVLLKAGLLAALGPTVPIQQAHLSFRRARKSLELERRGLLSASGLLYSPDHLLALLLFADAELSRELALRNLAALSGESPASSARLRETLMSWMRHQGSVPAIASELHIHRQTVRYRLGRLRELFGRDLEDPERRLEIELSLRALGSNSVPASDPRDGSGDQTAGPLAGSPPPA